LKILITGGNGFIGKNLREYFYDKYEVFAPLREELNLLNNEDLLNYLSSYKFDVIIHSANHDSNNPYNIKSPEDTLYQNLQMFFNLEKNKHLFGKMFSFGSGADLDRNFWQANMSERYLGKHIPKDVYGFSKYIITKYTEQSYFNTVFRLFGVYGKYEDWRTRFISNACCRIIEELPIFINENRTMNYLYVEDLCRIIDMFLVTNCKHKVYNLCSNITISLFGIAKYLKDKYYKKTEILCRYDETKSNNYSGNNSLLLSEFDNISFTSITQGVDTLFNYYLTNKPYDKKFLQEQYS